MTEPEPLITPPPALGPPIIGTDTPGSAPGTVQPVYKSGSATAPATPIPITGTPILPPPPVGDPVGYPTFPPTGSNTAPVPVPPGPLVGPAVANAAVPPSIAGIVQPQYKSGSATVPTAASLFPEFTTTSPSPPVVFANTAMIGTGKPPSTATTAAIVISTAPAIPQLPWAPGPAGLPIITTPPAITGSTVVAHVLTATTGTWSNSPTSYAYEWLRGGDPIAGANAATYTTVTADVGHMIAVVVTATNTAGEASAESTEVGPITATTRGADNPDVEVPHRATQQPQHRAASHSQHRAPTKTARKR